MSTLHDVLSVRATQALTRAEKLAENLTDVRSASPTQQVEIEQSLDDADRYLRLAERIAGVQVRSEPRTYRPDGSHSFFADVVHRQQDSGARERLQRHQAEMRGRATLEQRDVDSADFGGLIPPQYVLDIMAPLASAGRPFADYLGSRPLPANGMEVVTGRITGASSAVAQDGENDPVASADPTMSSVSLPVRTVSGQLKVSRQLIDRSSAQIDVVVAQELALQHAQSVDSDLLNANGTNGTVTGIRSTPSIGTVSITSTDPTAQVFVSKVAAAASASAIGRGLPPDVVVMHSRRWFWLLSRADTDPLVPGSIGAAPAGAPSSVAGTIASIPVVIDDNVPTNVNTDQDVVIVTRLDALAFFEDRTPRVLRSEVAAPQTYGLTVWSDIAFDASRYPAASTVISGAGLAVVAS